MEGFYVILSGVLLLAIGLWLFKREKALHSVCTEQTTGRVEDIWRETEEKWQEDKDGKRYLEITDYYFPVFSYTVNGRNITVKSSVDSGHPRFSPGMPVTIFYNPGKEEQYYIAKESAGKKKMSYLAAIIGVALIGIGIAVMISE